MPTNQKKEDRLTLDLLGAIEKKDDVSQRHLAQHMGVALGMANSYLKRCVKKGWIKVSTAPANRYMYYLTPTGFAEKARLTGEFLTTSLALVRQSGEAYTSFFEKVVQQDSSKELNIVFVGLSDLTEMAYLRALKLKVNTLGVYVPQVDSLKPSVTLIPNEWFSMPVVTELPVEWQSAMFIFTSLEHGYQVAEFMHSQHADCELFIPEFLSLIPPSTEMVEVEYDQRVNH